MGENIPESTAVEQWKQSKSHKANMLGNYNLCGIGVVTDNSETKSHYFTQMLVLI